MFIYLAKKITLPNATQVRALAWENEQGWIACGGDNALLKLLRLDPPSSTHLQHAQAMSLSQSLDGHNASVLRATWNALYTKLTTADANGLIIVWGSHKGVWYEEMINDRANSTVADLRWSRDGTKIAIAYTDGALILGSVDGNRILAVDLTHRPLHHVRWSPDARYLLLVAENPPSLHLYDASTASHISALPTIAPTTANHSSNHDPCNIVCLDWYDGRRGYVHPLAPCLAVGFSDGKLQLSRHERDTAPIAVESGMSNMLVKWNHNGSVLAVGGVQHIINSHGDERSVLIVQLYSPHGHYLRYLKVPGTTLSALSWEHDGLRLALAVDAYIYFANLRPDYRWCALPNTICYTYLRQIVKSLDYEQVVVFWNHVTGERHTKVLSNVSIIVSNKATYALLLSTANDTTTSVPNSSSSTISNRTDNSNANPTTPATLALICNSIGTTIESFILPFTVKYAVITSSHVIVANNDIIAFWQFGANQGHFQVQQQRFAVSHHTNVLIKAFHIDRPHALLSVDTQKLESWDALLKIELSPPTSDPILAIDVTASSTALVVSRAPGTLMRFTLPNLTLESSLSISLRAHSIHLNCDATKLAIIDMAGVLRVLSLLPSTLTTKTTTEQQPDMSVEVERKDVWDIAWSSDTTDLLAIMEKNRMYVIRGSEPEEPIQAVGYIGLFNNLQITTVNLDDIAKHPESPTTSMISVIETKSLRDTKNILSQVGLLDAFNFADSNPHPRLWRSIYEAAMISLDFTVAHKACVRSLDYAAIQYIKRVQRIDDKLKQRAEITAYFGQADTAEQMYLDMDRKDLAIAMRMQHGDFFRVVQLAKANSSDDHIVEKCWNNIGEYYFDRQKWTQAITYFAQARNFTRLALCHYYSDDFESLEKLVYSLPDNSPTLKDVGYHLSSVGMCEEAITAFVKAGDPKLAVDTCIRLNQWDRAVALAEVNNVVGIEELFTKYASHLLAKDKPFDAILLYRKANHCHKSAQMLFDQALKAIKEDKSPVYVKKVFVLGALEVERFHTLHTSIKGRNLTGSQTIASVLEEDRDSVSGPLRLAAGGLKGTNGGRNTRFLDTPWLGAEAMHLFILAQKQLYAGQYPDAVRTAQHLRNYEDILDPFTVYALIAVAALKASAYAICSRAFIRLEALSVANEDRLQRLENLAVHIFTQ